MAHYWWGWCGLRYAKLEARKNKNVIKEITTPNDYLSSHSSTIISHFKEIFNAPYATLRDDTYIYVGSLVPLSLHCSLLVHVSDEETKAIVFAGKVSSAPRLDEFSFEFYKHSWHLICHWVCSVIKSFFSFGYLSRSAKETVITMIPIKSHASEHFDFRPI